MNFPYKSQALIVLVFFLLLFLVLFSLRERKASLTCEKSLSEWALLTEKLPKNRDLGENHPRKSSLIADNKKEVTRKFSDLLEGVHSQMERELSEKKFWLPHEKGLSWKRKASYFQPYALKMEFQEDQRVFFFGDLHGDLKTLVSFLTDLKEKNLLEDNFLLRNKNDHLVFLGDFTDRGNYGLEVLYTLLNLKYKNEKQVVLVRGNHEDLKVYSAQGFLKELRKKVSSPESLSQKIMEFYEILPVVSYVGRDGSFLQACHGGLEPKYLPEDFLNSKKTKFDLISPFLLDEKNELKEGWKEPQDMTVTGKFFGFMWADFQFKEKKKGSFVREGRYSYSQKKTLKTLERDKLIGVVRAHQHREHSPVMEKLFTHGLFRFWQKDEARELELPVTFGSVFMLNMGVDSERWAAKDLKEATYGELLLKEKLSSWKMKIHKVKVF